MEDIKWMSDAQILQGMGDKLREWRLDSNLSQSDVAMKAEISLITYMNMEHGKGCRLSHLIRALRVLDKLDALERFMEERQISPIAYQKFEQGLKVRRRASKKRTDDPDHDNTPVW